MPGRLIFFIGITFIIIGGWIELPLKGRYDHQNNCANHRQHSVGTHVVEVIQLRLNTWKYPAVRGNRCREQNPADDGSEHRSRFDNEQGQHQGRNAHYKPETRKIYRTTHLRQHSNRRANSKADSGDNTK